MKEWEMRFREIAGAKRESKLGSKGPLVLLLGFLGLLSHRIEDGMGLGFGVKSPFLPFSLFFNNYRKEFYYIRIEMFTSEVKMLNNHSVSK